MAEGATSRNEVKPMATMAATKIVAVLSARRFLALNPPSDFFKKKIFGDSLI
jgi:hypothetical protein